MNRKTNGDWEFTYVGVRGNTVIDKCKSFISELSLENSTFFSFFFLN